MNKKLLKNIVKINFKTIIFNFNYFPFQQAIKLPVLVSRNTYLKRLRGDVKIECPIRFGMIKIGYNNCHIFDKKLSRTIWRVDGKVKFKGTANIGHGSKINLGKEGKISIGDNFTINAESTLKIEKGLTIGNDVLISWDVLIMDSDCHHIYQEEKIINPPQDIHIADKVWVGCRNLILKGAQIRENSVIGANSLVNNDLLTANAAYVGTPARMVKEGICWEK